MEATACSLPTPVELRSCLHCASPVSSRAPSDFCCHGCETVYGILQQSGLNRYYSILKRTGDRALPVAPPSAGGSGYTWLDQAEIRNEYETEFGVRFYLEGVHCAACVWLVEKLPTLVPGVASARLDLGSAIVTVRLDPQGAATYSEAAHGLLRVGYRPHPIRTSEADELRKKEDRKLLTQLGVAAAASGNIMLMAISLYAGADGTFARDFKWLSFGLSLPVMFYSALPFYQSSLSALKARQLSIDVPVALGLQVSFWVSVANLLRGHEHIYFDSVTALIFLLLSSRYLLRRVQRSSLNAASLAHFLMPATARKLGAEGTFVETPLHDICVGDELEILPGDLIPADGIVLHGASTLNSSLLTGESRPEVVQAGDTVYGGTQNEQARLTIRVTSSGRASRIGRILESMESTLKSRAPIIAFSDKVSRVFIAVTLLLLPLVFWGGLEHGWQEGLDRALALALVTCPCAFALATPLSFASVLGKAAKSGILIKGAEVLERLSQIETAYFDKTGTLTEGRFQVLQWQTSRELSFDPASLIVALESNSRHPIARALVDHFSPLVDKSKIILENHREIQGRGVEATWLGKTYELRAANPESEDPSSSTCEDPSASTACTRIGLYEDGVLIGKVSLGDPIRKESQPTLLALKELNIQSKILSGDGAEAVNAVASAIGVSAQDATYSATPEKKKRIIEDSKCAIMVGDGANDAVALAAASVGISVHGGLEASVRASDIYLSRPGLRQIPALIVIGRETLKVVRRNFTVSLGYNAVAATAAALGKIDPLFAAILMPISAFAVFASANVGTRRLRAAIREIRQ
jgi:Cu2+-exporting ATPase